METQNDQICEDQPESLENEKLFVTELSEFLPLFLDWHDRQVATLQHLLLVPTGTAVEIEDSETLVLEGDALRGFQLGLSMAMHYLGTLPFNTRPSAETLQ